MEIEGIVGLINRDLLENQIRINKDDYGGACIAVAINVMRYLDSYEGYEFNIGYSPDMTTPHGIICNCDDQGGITGYMAGVVRNLVSVCHRKGWCFWIADVISPLEIEESDTILSRIDNLCKNLSEHKVGVSRSEIESYVEGMLSRHKIRKKAKEFVN